MLMAESGICHSRSTVVKIYLVSEIIQEITRCFHKTSIGMRCCITLIINLVLFFAHEIARCKSSLKILLGDFINSLFD